jgi:hypothetical protein
MKIILDDGTELTGGKKEVLEKLKSWEENTEYDQVIRQDINHNSETSVRIEDKRIDWAREKIRDSRKSTIKMVFGAISAIFLFMIVVPTDKSHVGTALILWAGVAAVTAMMYSSV